ncbi:MAG: V-type H(+)-translocating pyrophosphatase [Wenzhouxiangella sp.]|nr:MAG: V-type H(+)-translocating pyrophosphatase [Wenzhouxiangella sp.]
MLSYILIFGLGLVGLAVAFVLTRSIVRIPVDFGAESPEEASRLKQMHKAIADGAMAFLTQEYRYIAWFMIGFALVIGFAINDPSTDTHEGIYTAISFIFGGLISLAAGFIGMRIATEGNVRTATSARNSIADAFKVALNSGAVMGFGLVGLTVIGLLVTYLVMAALLDVPNHVLMEVVAGFALGGSTIALFGRVGGGIYTKAADVGADLVGKVEAGIPEDDPRNPAVIADNVGDNVGDVAGMGSDLFGSVAESTCAAMVIGATAFAVTGMLAETESIMANMYPILISAVGIPISLLTILMVKVRSEQDVAPALKKMLIIASVLMAIAIYFLTMWALPASFEIEGHATTAFQVYLCFLTGLVSGLAIGLFTEYYTSHDFKPVRELADSCSTGAATNIIFGLALGFKSVGWSIMAIAVAVYIPFTLAGMYGVAVAALGMLGTLVVGLAIDAYGPVSDNAGGIAEMAEMGEEIRERTDVLDAAGNTTAAIGKGFAIGSAILTALALFAAFITRAMHLDEEFTTLNLLDPLVLTGLFVGTILPFLFSAQTMKSVGAAAFEMIEEVRRQFRTIPGIMEGTGQPDYKRCVAISTRAALREMIAPSVLIIGSPLVVGFLFGIEALAGLLIGSLLVGGGLAISSSNSGGAWDNAKKYIEKGHLGGKGTEAHKAAVVGDTVGDPLKDTSGPSLNILIKLMAIISLVFVPFFVEYGGILTRYIN